MEHFVECKPLISEEWMLQRISGDHYYNSRFFLIVQVQPIEPYVYAKISRPSYAENQFMAK